MPPATGKFSICAANTNAAASPISGTLRGGRWRLAWYSAAPTPTAARVPVVAIVLVSRKPSGMCMDIYP